MAREYFNAYHSYLKSIDPLNDAERGRLFAALLDYSSTGAEPELRGNERFVFPMMRQQIDRDSEKYEAKCEINRLNGSLGGVANASERYRTLANAPRTPPKEKAKDKEKTKEDTKAKDNTGDICAQARFVPPKAEEVSAYCLERGNGIDGQSFIDFYESKGWMIGKNRMKDWKAAVRTWEKQRSAAPTPRPKGYMTSENYEPPAPKAGEVERLQRFLKKLEDE